MSSHLFDLSTTIGIRDAVEYLLNVVGIPDEHRPQTEEEAIARDLPVAAAEGFPTVSKDVFPEGTAGNQSADLPASGTEEKGDRK